MFVFSFAWQVPAIAADTIQKVYDFSSLNEKQRSEMAKVCTEDEQHMCIQSVTPGKTPPANVSLRSFIIP